MANKQFNRGKRGRQKDQRNRARHASCWGLPPMCQRRVAYRGITFSRPLGRHFTSRDLASAITMKALILNLFGIFILSTSLFGQTLTDAQVIAAIDRALSGKRHQIGLTLNDVQTNLFSGLVCTTCKTTGYTIFVYPPESWIELTAVQARREMLPFGLQNVTPEMRLPYIHILASPSRPEYLSATGMGMASSVHRVVLSSTDKSDVIQPLSESQAAVESNSALRSFTQSSAGAVFSMEDLMRLRSEDPKREFFIVVVGDNQNKYFKVKTKFFNQLFGVDSDSEYAERKSAMPAGGPMKKPELDNTHTNTAETQQVQGSTRRTIDTGTTSTPGSRDELVPAPSVARASASVASTQRNPGIRTKVPTPAFREPDAHARKEKSGVPQSDAYRHDNALVAEWWNLREPNDEDSTRPKPLASDPPSMEGKGSIGAWCDANPRIRRDGVRIDRIASNGPADQAGLQIGDDILALEGVYLFTVEELMNKIREYRPGTRVSVRYRRRSTIYDGFVILA